VYSIQYVVWLLPFLAFLRGRQFLVAAAITSLTIPIHPLLYGRLIEQEALPVILLNVRNALLLLLTAMTMWSIARPREQQELEPAPHELEPAPGS
jgi:hypothetical protein